MGMPCEVNSMLKLKSSQGYPKPLALGQQYEAYKEGYRILPIDSPIALVDENWLAHADITITRLVWEGGRTWVVFEVDRVYPVPFLTKA